MASRVSGCEIISNLRENKASELGKDASNKRSYDH
jgi:hypothetical protein